MVGIDPTAAVRLVRDLIRSARQEQRVVGVEHLSREDREPFPGYAARVDAFLVIELDREFGVLHVFSGSALQLMVRVFEDVCSAHVQVQDAVSVALLFLVELLVKVRAFVVEFKDLLLN